jgi:hypothetical protein
MFNTIYRDFIATLKALIFTIFEKAFFLRHSV